MNAHENRKREIVRKVAEKAWNLPLLSSGLWFHGDIRDNFYYASYLFAAAVDPAEVPPFERREAKQLAEQVLSRVLRLQDSDPDSSMYGHWPLNLGQAPDEAAPHELPAELMSSLMAYFHQTFGGRMSETLAAEFEAALQHAYRGGFYRKPLTLCNHHEAKYTAAKLIFGELFGDKDLLEDGARSLELTIERLRLEGMAEYGCLPWFWHWIQAFTCAMEFAEESGLKRKLADLLDELWTLRASCYLKGAWTGAHSRGWPHDAPRDANVLFDYVQFGDFGLPYEMPRTEYAGFLFHPAPEAACRLALDRKEPSELRRAVLKSVDGEKRKLHAYSYIAADYAVGGLWERVREFDNEQLRWLFSLPVRANGQGNQLYFFHPGEGYDPSGSDPRHQSGWTEVLYHKNVVMALYPLPEQEPVIKEVIGVLPAGEWIFEPEAMFGSAEGVYFAVYVGGGAYEVRPKSGYSLAVCSGSRIGIVVEAVSAGEAGERGAATLKDFAEMMAARRPLFHKNGGLAAEYTGFITGDAMSLALLSSGSYDPCVNGIPISLGHYEI